ALTGLLFVAVSINSRAIHAPRNLSSRAAQSLTLFMITVLVAIILATPQPAGPIGWELVGLAVASGALMLALDRRAGPARGTGAARFVERFSPNTITCVLVGVAGLTLLLDAGGGLYWLLPAAIVGLAGGVVSSWLFLIRVDDGPGA